MHGIADSASPTSGISDDQIAPISDDQIAVTVRRGAQLLDISERYLWQLVMDGAVPSIKVGRARRILRSDLVAFAESRRAA